jgi:NYN domain
MRTTVYIDGFNLYYRLLRARSPIKWVNPLALVQRILPDNEITKVRYFTARVSGRLDPDAPHRQQLYLDALSTVPEIHIHYGTFLEKPKYAGLVTPVLAKKHNNDKTFRPWPDVAYVWKTEEKGSDVNIATYLLLDAFQHSYEVAAVLSNDGDLIEPIRLTALILGKPVGLLSPVPNPTPALRAAATFLRHVTVADIDASQFPNPVVLASGVKVYKPLSWA